MVLQSPRRQSEGRNRKRVAKSWMREVKGIADWFPARPELRSRAFVLRGSVLSLIRPAQVYVLLLTVAGAPSIFISTLTNEARFIFLLYTDCNILRCLCAKTRTFDRAFLGVVVWSRWLFGDVSALWKWKNAAENPISLIFGVGK